MFGKNNERRPDLPQEVKEFFHGVELLIYHLEWYLKLKKEYSLGNDGSHEEDIKKAIRDLKQALNSKNQNNIRKIQQIIETLETHGYCPRGEEAKRVFESWVEQLPEPNVAVNNMEPQDEMKVLVTTEQVEWFLKNLIPPQFLLQLTQISHMGANKTKNVGALCRWKMGEDGKYSYQIEIHFADPYIKAGASEEEEESMKKLFLSFLFHEIGHLAHTHMDYDDMVYWEQVIGEDKTLVSWWAQFCRNKPNLAKKEDFAESFSLFYNQPVLLEILSPARYDFMYNYITGRLKSVQKQKFEQHLERIKNEQKAIWSGAGILPEAAREIYLKEQNRMLEERTPKRNWWNLL